MKVNSKVIKRRTGKSKGKWVVKIEYFDELTGRKRYVERHSRLRGEAVDLRNRLVDEIKASQGQSPTGEKMSFRDLANIALKTFYRPAEIIDGRKILGVRSYDTVKRQLKTLNDYFGERQLRQITPESLSEYKVWRLKTGSVKLERQLRISTVNRELSTMRRLMRFAFGKGWVLKDIFFNAKVIDTSAELERKRILSDQEEARLLASCSGEREIVYTRNRRGREEKIRAIHDRSNSRLKAIILLALDSAMRRGEILKLRWEDIDLENRVVRIIGTHTKTERERLVPLSDRTVKELEYIRRTLNAEVPFDFDSFKRSWKTALKDAGIEDLQFRDLRRTAISRWQHLNIPLAMAGKLAGHTQLQTTMKHYTAVDLEAVRNAAEIISNYGKEKTVEMVTEAVN